MSKKKVYLTIFFIFVLAFFSAYLVYPKYFKIPNFPETSFKLGLDLQGGTHLVYEADLSSIEESDITQSMEGLRDVIERRVNYFGVSEPLVQVQGTRLIVELAGIIDPAEAIRQIGQTPLLEFKEPKPNYEEIIQNNQNATSADSLIEDPFQSTPLTGKYLKKSEVGFDETIINKPLILLQFDSEGSKLFEELTERNVGKPIAIYIDGIPLSAPIVQEKISGGSAQITGSFTNEEARSLVRNLNAGALPVPINIISQQSIGPTLGAISLQQSLKAGIFGFITIILFMIAIYRLPGLMASIALAIYVVLVLAVFKTSVTLTLAGIGGFILSIGMAVDANVLIFSRIREELRFGKDFSLAIEEGFKRAWPAIRDGNLTTLIVTAILFGFGTSFVKGFALTLSVGIIISIFSAMVITKSFLRVFVGTKLSRIKWLWS